MPHNAELSLTLIFVICDRGKANEITPFLKRRDALFSVLGLGKGTASSKILAYLGLGEAEKTFMLSVMPTADALDVLTKIDDALDLQQPGHGIAFNVPVDGVCLRRDVKAVSWIKEEDVREENGGDKVAQEFQHALILAVANRGYSQEIMDAARGAKATGGTIIHGRGTASIGAEKFLGVTLQPEREIILILASRDAKDGIMQAIASKSGVGTPANAITFSLPAGNVKGLREYIPKMPEA